MSCRARAPSSDDRRSRRAMAKSPFALRNFDKPEPPSALAGMRISVSRSPGRTPSRTCQEKIGGRDATLALRAPNYELRLERDHRGRKLGRGIRMGKGFRRWCRAHGSADDRLPPAPAMSSGHAPATIGEVSKSACRVMAPMRSSSPRRSISRSPSMRLRSTSMSRGAPGVAPASARGSGRRPTAAHLPVLAKVDQRFLEVAGRNIIKRSGLHAAPPPATDRMRSGEIGRRVDAARCRRGRGLQRCQQRPRRRKARPRRHP